MGISQHDTVQSWLDGVRISPSLQRTSSQAEHLGVYDDLRTPIPTSTSMSTSTSSPSDQHTRKTWESDSFDSMPQLGTEPPSEVQAPVPSPWLVRGIEDTPSLASAGPTTSRDEQSPSLNLDQMKNDLRRASPRITFLNEISDPGCSAAKELLKNLTAKGPSVGNHEAVKSIYTASCEYASATADEFVWYAVVAIPLLKEAIGDLPLEDFSVQPHSVDDDYQPRHTNGERWRRTIDLAVGLPAPSWEAEYAAARHNQLPRIFNHLDDPSKRQNIMSLGVVVKSPASTLVEAEVQLGVWMAGLLMWASLARRNLSELPPLVGCTAVGQDWKFYIIFGIQGSSGELVEVRVWGPLFDLNGSTQNEKSTRFLLRTLRKVMEYTSCKFARQIFQVLTPERD